MLQTRTIFFKTSTSRSLHHLHSTINASSNFTPIPSIPGPFTTLSTNDFRRHAFTPEKPLLITASSGISPPAFPAAQKWFISSGTQNEKGERLLEPNLPYLEQFSDAILPYELITPPSVDANTDFGNTSLAPILKQLIENSDGTTFHRFSAPLSLFLLATSSPSISPAQCKPRLYIAQAQLLDLPPELRTDLPTPHIVLGAGKGDVYDANIWLGIPPTYTPLHKDPNPNLFVQIAGRKVVRILEPTIGRAILGDVRREMGEAAREAMRGAEMMEGVERELLHEAVWAGKGKEGVDGFEAMVGPMDALFIPNGWWHSIKSVGEGVNASVNWWFR